MELHVNFETFEDTEKYTCEDVETDFYRMIGERLCGLSVPNVIKITVDEYPGKAIEYEVSERGSFTKGGVEYPSMYVIETSDTIHEELESSDDYRHVFLTCINPESNNYKFYEMIPSGEDFFTVRYGRMNQNLLTFTPSGRSLPAPYESRMYWIRYYEKLSKGYVDNSDIYISGKENKTLRTKNGSPDKSKPVSKSLEEKLYHNLMEYSKKVVEENIMITRMTASQLARYNELYFELCATRNLEEFNKTLLELYTVCPRKMYNVSAEMASNAGRRKQILEKEGDLNASINAVFGKENKEQNVRENPFTAMDIELYSATYEQRKHVLDHLYDELKPKVRNIYRVIPLNQKEKFEKYLADHNIETVKELWHGSRNENWLSIIEKSLLLYPDAQITGKMFGDGIYFASNIYKSLNYTSLRGSYWSKGTDKVGYMGLFATAYGEPLKVDAPHHYSENDLIREHKNCVHAQKGTYLANDEIVFYNEDAVLLNYIVEFETND